MTRISSSLTFADCSDGETDELLCFRVDGHDGEALGYVLAAVVVEPGHPSLGNYVFEFVNKG